MIHDRPNHIRPVESVTAAAVIVFKVVIEGERLPTLERYRAIHAPAVLQARHVSAHLRKFESCNPRKSVRYVEIRRPVFPLRIGAVLRLRRVHDEILAVA